MTIDHPAFREMTATLWDQDVIPDFRAPQGIRIGLSPLSTSFAELYRGVAAIRELLSSPGKRNRNRRRQLARRESAARPAVSTRPRTCH